MIEKGMGRTRLGRLAAITIPATALSVGFGVAILQGAVSAQLSSADPFQVTAATGSGSGVELSLRESAAAAAQTDATEGKKGTTFVTLKNGKVNDVCLAANQTVPLLSNIGIKVEIPTGDVSLGDNVDVSADALGTGAVTLPQTTVGVAQNELDHQKTLTSADAGVDTANKGGFGIESGDANAANADAIDLADVDAEIYQVSVAGLQVPSVSITPTIGGVGATC